MSATPSPPVKSAAVTSSRAGGSLSRSTARAASQVARSAAGSHARQLVDVGTGEVILLRQAAPTPRHGENFTMVFQKDMLALISSPAGTAMSALQLRVLVGLWSMVGFDNLMPLNVTHLARSLGAHRTSVSRAVSSFERLGLVRIVVDATTGTRQLRLNPHLAYRGRVGQRRDAVARDTWAPNGQQMAAAINGTARPKPAGTAGPAEPTSAA